MQKIGTAAVIGLMALAAAGCGKKDEAPTANGAAVSSEAVNVSTETTNVGEPGFSPAQAFANSAAGSDAFEIQSSQLALASASSPTLKTFAQQMIDAHTESTGKLKEAASKANPVITPDPTLDPDQQTALAGLTGKTGAEFDRAYVAAQIDAHQKTLDALRAYATAGDSPVLQAFAKETIPVVTAHLNMAKALKP